MSELYNVTPNCELCKSCYYYRHQNSTNGSCDYIGIEGHSRVFEARKRRLEKGTCDKYTIKKGRFI